MSQNQNTVAEILKSKDYSMFKLLDGNRSINKLHLKRLKQSMSEQYLLSPIIVNDRFEIIDGQHRFSAAMELGLPIYYFIVKRYGLKEVQRFNSNQKDFSYEDFMSGYCDLGYEDYIVLRDFRKKYNLDFKVSLIFLCGGEDGKVSERFRNGELKVKDLPKAELMAQRLNDFAIHYEGYKRRSFVLAFYKIATSKNYDHMQMLTKLRYMSSKLVDCVDMRSYLKVLETIYNYKSRGEFVRFAA